MVSDIPWKCPPATLPQRFAGFAGPMTTPKSKAAPARGFWVGGKGQGDKSKGGKGMVKGKPSSKDKGEEGEEGNGEGKAVAPEIVD